MTDSHLSSLVVDKTNTMANRNENSENIKVYLRLRPLNKFEANRRSRSVVEVIDDRRIAIEDPAEGDWEAELDGVSHECDFVNLYTM